MATSFGYDVPSALNISPSITVSKPSDKVATADVYKADAQAASNLFQPLKLSTNEFKKNMSGVMGGLQTAQLEARKYTKFATNTSIFSKGIDGATKINPSNLLQGLLKLNPTIANATKGFLSIPGVKTLGTITGTAIVLGNLTTQLKKTKAGTANSIFSLFNALTGSNINPKILDKGFLAAGLALIFGESAKNNIQGMWGNFKKIDLYGSIGLSVARSLAPVIIKYGDVDLLKDISEDAYAYALLEADSRLLYNFAAYYKLPQTANTKDIISIFTKFSTAANNLRPNWAYVNVKGTEQIDGYFITYGSNDFLKMLQIYVNSTAITGYDDETIFSSNEDYKIVVTATKDVQAMAALYALSFNSGLSKATTTSQIQSTLGLTL
jgi:hypothetical protein